MLPFPTEVSCLHQLCLPSLRIPVSLKDIQRSSHRMTKGKDEGLIGASSLDVAGLLALVAHSLSAALLRWTVPGYMAKLSAVVTLLSLGAVPTQMSESPTRVALLTTSAAASSTISTRLEATTTTSEAARGTGTARLRTVASDMPCLTTLVALLIASLLAPAWTLTRDVALLATTEASNWTASTATGARGVLCAFTLNMAFLATSVASWVALFRAVFRNMALLVAVVAGHPRGSGLHRLCHGIQCLWLCLLCVLQYRLKRRARPGC